MSQIDSENVDETYGWFFYLSLAVGWVLIAIGLRMFFESASANRPGYSAALSIGANIAHDAIFAPVVTLIAWLGSRVLPRAAVAPAAFAFFGSIAVLFIAAVPLYRQDDNAGNPTLLSINYTVGTGVVIGTVVSIALVWLAVRLIRAARRRPAVPLQ